MLSDHEYKHYNNHLIRKSVEANGDITSFLDVWVKLDYCIEGEATSEQLANGIRRLAGEIMKFATEIETQEVNN